MSQRRERCPSAEIRDLTPILDALRSVKSPLELDEVETIVGTRAEEDAA